MTLVEGLRLRVPEAYDLLFRAYNKRLKNVVFKITLCTEDAEDVVQNTFLQVFRCIESFRGDCQFVTWITRIAINQSLMILRRKKGKIVSLDVESDSGEHHLFTELRDRDSTPEQAYLGRELECSIIRLLTRLEQSSRQVFEMRFDDELSLDEIAERLGITLAAAKSKLYRARKEIRARTRKHLQLTPCRNSLQTNLSAVGEDCRTSELTPCMDLPDDWQSMAS